MKPIKLVRIDLDKSITDLVNKTDHRTLWIWAADCAERVLHYFEEEYPEDNRPRRAIEDLRIWIEIWDFEMSEIRWSSLAAHAAARGVLDDDIVARSAARSAGQVVATAHVPTHAVGAAIYAATAIRDATGSIDEVNKERDWQFQHLVDLNKAADNSIYPINLLWRGIGKNVIRKF